MFSYILRGEHIPDVLFFPALLLWFRHFEGGAHSVSHTLMLWGHQGHVSCLPKHHGSDSGCSPVNHSKVSCFQQKKTTKKKKPELAVLSKREMQLTKDCH